MDWMLAAATSIRITSETSLTSQVKLSPGENDPMVAATAIRTKPARVMSDFQIDEFETCWLACSGSGPKPKMKARMIGARKGQMTSGVVNVGYTQKRSAESHSTPAINCAVRPAKKRSMRLSPPGCPGRSGDSMASDQGEGNRCNKMDNW